jgi:endoglucanase
VELTPFLKALSEASGVSGYEDGVGELVREQFAPCVDELRTDALGNIIALRRGTGPEPRPRIMLAGHMDEIGLIVTRLDGAFLRFTQVGGFDVRTLPGQEVTVHGRRPLHGIIGCRPPHVLSAEDRGKPYPMEDLFIDVGMTADELAKVVRTGDIVTLAANCVELKNERLAGKAFDDRAAVAAIAVCLEELARSGHQWDVYAVATVQEEIGLRGATVSAFGIAPDVGIAIDVGFAKQPGFDGFDAIELDKGPALAMGPNIHPKLFDAIKQVAEDQEIPYQTSVYPRGTGTDANAIQITRDGIATALLSLPERSMHTPAETICVRDIARTGRLLARFIQSLDADSLASLAWDTPATEENGK